MKKKSKFGVILAVVVSLMLFVLFISAVMLLFMDDASAIGANTAVIPVKGFISTEEQGSPFMQATSSGSVVELIEKANSNPAIKAIVLEINSGGGAPVATEEIANALAKTNKTKVAWIREIGASGAYWIATECDAIVASRMSVTGSVGVLGSYLDFSGFIERYNITYQKLTGGKYKDMQAPFRELRPDERRLAQERIDLLHDIFIEQVSDKRGIGKADMHKIATGIYFLGEQAKDLGLVDVLGGKDEAFAYIQNKLNITVAPVRYEQKKGFLEAFAGLSADNMYSLGYGIGNGLIKERQGLSLS